MRTFQALSRKNLTGLPGGHKERPGFKQVQDAQQIFVLGHSPRGNVYQSK